jgi:hypothetical protein
MKKVSFIILALVLAMGVLGVGYAMWSDTFNIAGTVKTGDIDINFDTGVYLSSTYVYKVIEATTIGGIPLAYGATYFYSSPEDGTSPPLDVSPLDQIAKAVASDPASPDDQVNFDFTNIFPTKYSTAVGADGIACTADDTYAGEELIADAKLVYQGSVPAHLKVFADLTSLPACIQDALRVKLYLDEDADGTYESSILLDTLDTTPDVALNIDPWQLHDGYKLKVEAWFDSCTLQAGNTSCMNADASFSIKLVAYQWNEPAPATPP